jgi:hypothetical protein
MSPFFWGKIKHGKTTKGELSTLKSIHSPLHRSPKPTLRPFQNAKRLKLADTERPIERVK